MEPVPELGLIEKIHIRRPKHQRLMTLASTKVLEAARWKSIAKYEPESGFTAEGVLLTGFMEMRGAIDAVVRCGCRRELWPVMVQEAIKKTVV